MDNQRLFSGVNVVDIASFIAGPTAADTNILGRFAQVRLFGTAPPNPRQLICREAVASMEDREKRAMPRLLSVNFDPVVIALTTSSQT
jgi:hypothetical protein